MGLNLPTVAITVPYSTMRRRCHHFLHSERIEPNLRCGEGLSSPTLCRLHKGRSGHRLVISISLLSHSATVLHRSSLDTCIYLYHLVDSYRVGPSDLRTSCHLPASLGSSLGFGNKTYHLTSQWRIRYVSV